MLYFQETILNKTFNLFIFYFHSFQKLIRQDGNNIMLYGTWKR
jgi:hypothetical protein